MDQSLWFKDYHSWTLNCSLIIKSSCFRQLQCIQLRMSMPSQEFCNPVSSKANLLMGVGRFRTRKICMLLLMNLYNKIFYSWHHNDTSILHARHLILDHLVENSKDQQRFYGKFLISNAPPISGVLELDCAVNRSIPTWNWFYRYRNFLWHNDPTIEQGSWIFHQE